MGIRSIKFRGRHVSIKSAAALAAGIVSIILLIAMFVTSGINGGTSSFAAGAAGVAAFFISVAGFIVSAVSVKERDIYYAVPVAGMIVNGVSLLSYLVVYIIGS